MDYNDKLRLAKEALDSGSYDKETIEYIFPELKESEDERIRYGLIGLLKFGLEDGSAIAPGSNVTKEQAIDWLKKQAQKPMWTEEDEKCIDNCCLLIGAADDCYEKPFKDDCIHYLQSLKERVAWKPEWTDEDEERLQSCISTLQGKGLIGGVDTINTKWLKSLKQRMQ